MSRRRNPNLVIYNPPTRVRRSVRHGRVVGMIASNVESVKYFDEQKLATEGSGYWEHEFDGEVRAFAVEGANGQRNILLTAADGRRLWFEDGED